MIRSKTLVRDAIALFDEHDFKQARALGADLKTDAYRLAADALEGLLKIADSNSPLSDLIDLLTKLGLR